MGWCGEFLTALAGRQGLSAAPCCTGFHLHAGQRLEVVVRNPDGFEVEVTGTVNSIGGRTSHEAERVVLIAPTYR